MLVAIVLLSLAGGAGLGSRAALLSATSTAATVGAAPDWVPPAVPASVIHKSSGGTPGQITAGSTYFVYASISDSGNPASGVASATADVSSITVLQTAAPLSAGSWTVGGTSYNYRSGLLTASLVLLPGTYGYSVTATDGASNIRTQTGFTVTVTLL